ncbi:hypothetical protein KKH27_04040, partial [bacterium]|nr:hypothetical protein [bacterium]MBU1985510.1 hypothetical protein [bacterium]
MTPIQRLRLSWITLLWAGIVLSSPRGWAGPLDLYPALLDTLMGGHYRAADSLCAQLAADHPGHPAVPYALATVRYTHMIDMEDSVGRAEFLALADTCVAWCRVWEKRGEHDRTVLDYLKGSAYSTKGLLLLHEGNPLGGIRLLFMARDLFAGIIAAQPDFYDAYLGRGAYRASVARYASYLKWLPVVPTEGSGWDDLWLTVEKSRFSRYSALSAMVWFAIEDRDFALADSIVQLGRARFPTARAFLWPKLAVEVRQRRWADANVTAGTLLNQYLNHPDNNGYETTGLYWRLMICADSLGRPNEA